MAPTVYGTDGSPPTRAVYLCAKALGLEVNLKEVSPAAGTNKTPEYLKINPQHTVPTLEDDDGFIVSDSHAIMGYLVDKYGKNDSLYPKDLKQRATVNQRLHFDNGVVFPRGLGIMAAVFYRNTPEINPDDLKKLEEAFDFLEKFLEKGKYVAGDQLTIADFSLVTSVTSMSVILPLDPSKYPRIVAWLKQMQQLPYYGVNVAGNEKLHNYFKAKLADNKAKAASNKA